MDGQFFPGQAIQFEGLPPRNPWYPWQSAATVLTRLGLTSNLQLCLDAGDSASYSSGQSWLDLSGNGYDFFLGADGSATATDPTHNGAAGGLSSSEYFSVDGGDYFTYDTTNETWMENLHKDNAAFTLMAWLYSVSGTGSRALFGTTGQNLSTDIGAMWHINPSNVFQLQVFNAGGGLSNGAGSTFDVLNDQFALYGISVNEATGSNGVIFQRNESFGTATSTYTSPSSSSASYTAHILSRGNAASRWPSGTRLGAFMAWDRALSESEMNAVYAAMRGRFGA